MIKHTHRHSHKYKQTTLGRTCVLVEVVAQIKASVAVRGVLEIDELEGSVQVGLRRLRDVHVRLLKAEGEYARAAV